MSNKASGKALLQENDCEHGTLTSEDGKSTDDIRETNKSFGTDGLKVKLKVDCILWYY